MLICSIASTQSVLSFICICVLFIKNELIVVIRCGLLGLHGRTVEGSVDLYAEEGETTMLDWMLA